MNVPTSTYRLQLHGGFGFDAAAGIVDYLRDLKISHVYCSPYLQAASGSTHGYDVVDYHQVNTELGGEAGRLRFCQKLKSCGLGQVLDIVPNHMAIGGHHNPWWWDTLENGPVSRYAPYFDIEWNAPEERLRNKILLPLLSDHIGRVLAAGEIALARQGGSFVVRYCDHSFPVAPESMAELLGKVTEQSGCSQLGFLADSLARLSGPQEASWEGLLTRHRSKEVIRKLLARLLDEHPEVAEQVDAAVRELNQTLGELDALLARQNYRLSRWQTAAREIAYRRFFDINTLIGVRQENERVFADTHQLVFKWLWSGQLDGVRVDHPDGLRDPGQYFDRLHTQASETWIVAEKILQYNERLPERWEIAGTTGYDFLNLTGGLFIDPRGEAPLNELYREFTGERLDFATVVREKKNQVLHEILGSDLNRLTGLLIQICEQNRDYRDYTRHEAHEAIAEVAAAFPVYRSYVQAEAKIVSSSDEEHISAAVDAAKGARPDLDERLFEFLRDVLLLRAPGNLESEFVMRFQQTTAAVMAKGIEDTAFYCYLRLVALNEVGGDPARFGTGLDDFHKWCAETQVRRPFTMLATSTHDTKRSEDVRARISILSEIPSEWAGAVKQWSAANARYRTGDLPDRKTEYLLYQTLVGAWPISKERITTYMIKAAREAKERTSWTAPNETFETALQTFLDGVLCDAEFLAGLEQFLAPLIQPARVASLSMTVLKFTAPGIPDIYQGTELWDLSLVDPDNRRPVDFVLRRCLLAELDGLSPEEILERSDEGLPKLWTIRQALRTRACHPASFSASGEYRPLWAAGPKADNLIAFQRNEDVITVAPRLLLSADGWDSTVIEVPEGRWRNQLTAEAIDGGKIEAAALLARFPVALLTKEAP
jgi:(1->4)-alpha-D-glucan 1-alpha-D-glucosylmutase